MSEINQLCKVKDIFHEYEKRLCSADEAVKVVKPGDRLHYGLFCGIIDDLDKALARRANELHDITVYDSIWAASEPPAILTADPKGEHFRYISTHMSALDRQMNKQGICWFHPVQFRENTKMWEENVESIDVSMAQAAPMDEYGYFNLGPQCGEYPGVFRRAGKIILEVNDKQPRVQGIENQIHVTQVDKIIEGSNGTLPQLLAKDATEQEKKIAGHIVELIESGSTIQLGIGGMPNYVGAMINDSDINDLSVHTEMFVDAYVKLFNSGKITGNKNTHKGKMLFTFAMGSQAVYDFLDNNPLGYIAPVDYVNALEVIAANDKVVSINSCLQVDLFGQVNSESAGIQHIGGTGGQLDYVMGAFKSKGGKSFLCTPSVRTGKDGKLQSLIMPRLPEGSIVSSPRSTTHYVVTEYGAVNLKGKTSYERAELLISIAHPDFREGLEKEAAKMGLTSRSSKVMI